MYMHTYICIYIYNINTCYISYIYIYIYICTHVIAICCITIYHAIVTYSIIEDPGVCISGPKNSAPGQIESLTAR